MVFQNNFLDVSDLSSSLNIGRVKQMDEYSQNFFLLPMHGSLLISIYSMDVIDY